MKVPLIDRARLEQRLLLIAMFAALALGIAACSGGPSQVNPVAVATFEVANGERFRVELVSETNIKIADDLADGTRSGLFPMGQIIRDNPGVNGGYSWHLDPETVHFVEVAMEICDGLPSHVQSGVLSGDVYCPWTARLVALEWATARNNGSGL
jgi:hypothetical protein